jgi:hypothetical protein
MYLARLSSFCVVLCLLPVPALAQASVPGESVVVPGLPTAPASAPPAVLAPPPEGCRPLTDKAMAADMKAITAQAQKMELTEQARRYKDAMLLWSDAAAQCDGRAKDRAQRNLADNQATHAKLAEQLASGPQCALAHKDADTLQDLARQALGNRRWTDAAVLFSKSEDMWDIASERCSGSQQELANRRREQSALDGHNAEHCAPLFEQAREQTQKLRTQAATLSRDDKQEVSQLAETLWRRALGQCRGAAVQDSARNNAQALARERGTPWVARTMPAPSAPEPVRSARAASPALLATPGPSAAAPAAAAMNASAGAALPGAGASAQAVSAPPLVRVEVPTAPAPMADFNAGTTRFSGQFTRDPGSNTYSGTGKVAWAQGDIYEGTLSLGLRQGKGRMTWANGQTYNGDWVKDQPTGQAVVRFANGNQYEGAVLNGVPHGQGNMRFASGDTYVGRFVASEPEGRGLYTWQNGQQFEGEWRSGRPNGQGRLKFANGNLFEGAVLDGVPHGEGRLSFPSGDSYRGQLVQGEPEGQGTFNWTDGSQYVGEWKAGKKHGKGVYSWKNGDRSEGFYENDLQVSQGAVRAAN